MKTWDLGRSPCQSARLLFPTESPADLPERLLRVPDVQGQDRRDGTAAAVAAPGTSRRRRRSGPPWQFRGASRLARPRRAHPNADFREPNVPNTFLLTVAGPCSRPSSPCRKLYITTSVARRPFLFLSPFFRRGFRPASLPPGPASMPLTLAALFVVGSRAAAAPTPAPWPWGRLAVDLDDRTSPSSSGKGPSLR